MAEILSIALINLYGSIEHWLIWYICDVNACRIHIIYIYGRYSTFGIYEAISSIAYTFYA